jgi:hypothetical protein
MDEGYFNIFAVLAKVHPAVEKEMRKLIERVGVLERRVVELEDLEDGTEEEVDRGEGTLTGQREKRRNQMEEQEEIDMEVSENEDAEGTEEDTEEGVVEKGKGKVTEKRMEGDENTLA